MPLILRVRRACRAHRADLGARTTDGQRGIVLLDLILAMAILALVVMVTLPFVPHGTTSSRHAAYALEIAAMLKTDRTAAARSGREVATQVDVAKRRIVSGATHQAISLPGDLTLDVVASNLCNAGPGRFAIMFAPDGRSCGAVIRIAKGARNWRVRINWLTGYVDVVGPKTG